MAVVTIRKRWSLGTIKAHAVYLVENAEKALDEVEMHGRRRAHITRNLHQLQTLAVLGWCDVPTDDQARFVSRRTGDGS